MRTSLVKKESMYLALKEIFSERKVCECPLLNMVRKGGGRKRAISGKTTYTFPNLEKEELPLEPKEVKRKIFSWGGKEKSEKGFTGLSFKGGGGGGGILS